MHWINTVPYAPNSLIHNSSTILVSTTFLLRATRSIVLVERTVRSVVHTLVLRAMQLVYVQIDGSRSFQFLEQEQGSSKILSANGSGVQQKD